MIARVLLAVTSKNTQRQIKRFLTAADVVIETPPDRVWERLGRATCDLLVVDQSLIPEPAGESLSSYASLSHPPALVVISDQEDPELRTRLMTAGCDAVLHAGMPARELAGVLRAILDKHLDRHRETLALKRVVQEPRLQDFVSNSPIMRDFMDLVQRVVSSNTSLLVLGETGVGKERLARAIHKASARSGAFVAVNCGALPESLLESELFGHEEGAFTGASRARRGCFELAHRGTIFLDEIGEMPTHLQVRLLRVLQEREVQRVGAEWPVRIDVRVMAATSRDLDDMAQAGTFRSDLMYRLSVVSLKVPPLRERKQDIPELVESYINHFSSEVGRNVQDISPQAIEALQRYDWPGNVRELVNAIERATLLCASARIELADLPEAIRNSVAPAGLAQPGVPGLPGAGDWPQAWLDRPLRELRNELIAHSERAYLTAQLDATGGRIDETARRAGITTRALFDKMRRYGLRKEDFRSRKSKRAQPDG